MQCQQTNKDAIHQTKQANKDAVHQTIQANEDVIVLTELLIWKSSQKI
jgi:hypothetical protein